MVMRPVVLLMVTPVGTVPPNEYVIGVVPVAVTWNVPPIPLTTDVLFALVIVGADGAAAVDAKVAVKISLFPLTSPPSTLRVPSLPPPSTVIFGGVTGHLYPGVVEVNVTVAV